MVCLWRFLWLRCLGLLLPPPLEASGPLGGVSQVVVGETTMVSSSTPVRVLFRTLLRRPEKFLLLTLRAFIIDRMLMSLEAVDWRKLFPLLKVRPCKLSGMLEVGALGLYLNRSFHIFLWRLRSWKSIVILWHLLLTIIAGLDFLKGNPLQLQPRSIMSGCCLKIFL